MSDWPRPPRKVHRRVLFATWGLFGRLACAMFAVSLLWLLAAWAGDDFTSPRGDWLLDAGVDTESVRGEVTAVARSQGKSGHPSRDAVFSFRFTDRTGAVVEGRSFGQARLQPGDRHGVEYLVADPTQCRLLGLHRAQVAQLLKWYAGYVLLPELLLVGLWLSRVYRTFATVRHGRATEAVLLARKLPDTSGRRRRKFCRLRYRFHGNDGSDHEATQHEWVGSPLARIVALAELGKPLPGAFVVHAETAPDNCRLVAAEEVTEAMQ